MGALEGIVRYKGTFDFEGLLGAIDDFFGKNKFKGGKPKVEHKEGSAGAKVVIKWYQKKTIHEWFAYEFTPELEIRNMKDVEVVKDGKKQKMQTGFIKFSISFNPKPDKYKRFKGTPFLERLGEWVSEVILKQEVEERFMDNLYGEAIGLRSAVKEYLGID